MPFSRNQLLVAVRETTYNVDPTPTGSNAINIQNVTITPMVADLVDRGLVVPYMGAQPAFVANKRARIEFETEITGSGALGVAPGYSPILRACAMAETVTASTRVDYDPVSTGFDSATLWFNLDGTRSRLNGFRGGMGMRFTSGQLPKFLIRGEGLDAGGPDAQALLTPTFANVAAPLAVSKANTTAFTLGGTSLIMRSLEVAPPDVVYRNLVNNETVEITDHAWTGTVVVDAVALGTFNPFTQAANAAQLALQLTHGTVAGNIVELQASRVQLGTPTIGDDNGIVTWSIPLRFIPASGSGDFKIRVR